MIEAEGRRLSIRVSPVRCWGAGRRALLGSVVLSPASSALKQGSPAHPMRVIVPYAAGGPTDSAVRAFSDRLSAVLGQPVVVENRFGGLGTIGAGLLAQ